MARADEYGEADESDEYSLADMLKMLGSGQFHEDATDAMKALCRNMEQVSRATGGTPKGQLVITMKFKLDRSIMEIEPTFKVTTPSPTRARTILFPDGKGNLHRNNQNQGTLPLEEKRIRQAPMVEVKSVPAPVVEERTVPETRGNVVDFRARQANDNNS
jgi:hypothetical protein